MILDDQQEEWRVIQEFPNYSVSDQGRVKRVISNGNNAKVGHILKPKKSRKGYCSVDLYQRGLKKTVKIHRIVLNAFTGSCPFGHEANHIDSDRSNNSLLNLEWITHPENVIHAYTYGHKVSQKGEKHGRAKLSNQDIFKIRSLLEYQALTQAEIAHIFEVHPNTIWRIKNRTHWRHI